MAKTKTQTRSYTLRLKAPSDCQDWLPVWKRLFLTHYAVCQGARVFGELYLNLRGGLSPSLAEVDMADLDSDEQNRARRGRRRLLALGWLSVEDDAGGNQSSLRIAEFSAGHQLAVQEAEGLLRSILQMKGVSDPALQQSWIDDCTGALTARIRDDAVWVNRAAAFAAWQKQLLHDAAMELPEQAKQILYGIFNASFVSMELPSIVADEADEDGESLDTEESDDEKRTKDKKEKEQDRSQAGRYSKSLPRPPRPRRGALRPG